MPAVPQKIRAGLVELHTNIGSVYVSPSFWERIYLLWTFRNFHRLPKQVLNRRQRQLVDNLCRTAIVGQNQTIARTSIIGAVENVYLIPDRRTEDAARTGKLVSMSVPDTDVILSRAVGSEGISIPSNRAKNIRTAVGRFRKHSGNVEYVSASKSGSAEQSKTKGAVPVPVGSDAGRTWGRLGGPLVAAFGTALIGILFYLREGRRFAPINVPQIAIEARKPSSESIPSADAARPQKIQQSVPSERTQRTTTTALEPTSQAVSSRQRESNLSKTMILFHPPVLPIGSTPEERLQVAEAPKSAFTYPIASNPSLTGTVSLKAVIGTDGTVREVEVLSGDGVLVRAAERAVRHWRYRSYEIEGSAVEAETNIVISFLGDDAVSVSFRAAH
jgi:Gram-negative bacterial TonB protein C-terminal